MFFFPSFLQVGLHKFLPRSVLNGMKPKALRKLIQQHFKKVAALSELECMFKFFDLLRAHYRFDQERFICALGVSDNVCKSSVYIRVCVSPNSPPNDKCKKITIYPRKTEIYVHSLRLIIPDCVPHLRSLSSVTCSRAGRYPWN